MKPEEDSGGDEAEGADDLRLLAARLKTMLAREVAALEAETGAGAFSEGRVRALGALTKALQSMEELTRKLELAADEHETQDIVEFRERLAKQIAALGIAEDGPEDDTDDDTGRGGGMD